MTTGGRALKFYASVRIEIRRKEHIKNGTVLMGSRTKAKVVKNKIAPPFKEAEFDIMYGEGISKTGELVDIGTELGLVQKSGSWFSMGETRIGQGREAAKNYFKEHPDIADALEKEIKDRLTGKNAAAAAEEPPAPAKAKAAPAKAERAARSASAGIEVFADDFEDDEP